MTEVQPAHWTQGACHSAQGDRQVLSSLVCTEGVHDVAGGGLLVDPGASGLSVDVAAGSAFIDGDSVATQGMYHVYNDGSVNIVLTASDPTDDRIDLIVATVNDAQYSGALNTWVLQKVTGTPSPAPTPPAVPANSIVLAEVLVGNGATSLIAGDITDERTPYELCAEAIGSRGLRQVVTFTASGTFTKADYPWLRAVNVRAQAGGGGGGGGGATAAGQSAAGGGGGGGGYAEKFLLASALGANETVTVGAAGAAGVGTGTGGTGGTSSFGAHVSAAGGVGGTGGASAVNSIAPGGTGGIGTVGDVLGAGGVGGVGEVAGGNRHMYGLGAPSMYGGGGAPGNNGNGSAAIGKGGGGGGATRFPSSGAVNGGAGTIGVVIVELYG